jgi:transcriptional regulator with XRE-family HTH domain
MDILVKFGNEVRRRRTALGLSQEELGHLCSLHRTYIGSIERGERNISLHNIGSISKALKCNPSELLECLNGDQ